MKIKIKRKYNDLTLETRKIIHFYVYERIKQELTQVLILYKEDIPPRLKRALWNRIKSLKKILEDEYEVEIGRL